MATYIEATGAGFAPQDQVELRWSDDGTLTLYAPTHNHGQGHETTFAQLLSGVLGLPLESFRLRTAGPSSSSPATPPAARARCSRSAAW
jgi:CO/xanthine dehydrogenase Mo-binding subunit